MITRDASDLARSNWPTFLYSPFNQNESGLVLIDSAIGGGILDAGDWVPRRRPFGDTIGRIRESGDRAPIVRFNFKATDPLTAILESDDWVEYSGQPKIDPHRAGIYILEDNMWRAPPMVVDPEDEPEGEDMNMLRAFIEGHFMVSVTCTISGASVSGSNTSFLEQSTTLTSVRTGHSHGSTASSSAIIAIGSITITVDGVAAQPLSVRMIVIKPDDASQDVPDDAICFSDETTLPTGFKKTDGLNGTSDYDGRFVIGAAAAGNGGGLLGVATHSHSTTGHTHSAANHTHAQKQAADGVINERVLKKVAGTGVNIASRKHHLVNLTSASPGSLSSESPGTSSESNDPAFMKLLGIQNKSGAAATSTGIILPYVGTVASIPGGWQYCNGDPGVPDLRDRQVQITTTDGQIGVTGGSNTHTHTENSHDHSYSSAHNHGQENSFSGCLVGFAKAGFERRVLACVNHAHTWTIGSTTPANVGSSTFSLDSADGRYLYRTVIFIKKVAASHLGYERMHRGVMRGAYRGAV